MKAGKIYTYVGNNALGYTDPNGLFAIPLGQALVDAETIGNLY